MSRNGRKPVTGNRPTRSDDGRAERNAMNYRNNFKAFTDIVAKIAVTFAITWLLMLILLNA